MSEASSWEVTVLPLPVKILESASALTREVRSLKYVYRQSSLFSLFLFEIQETYKLLIK